MWKDTRIVRETLECTMRETEIRNNFQLLYGFLLLPIFVHFQKIELNILIAGGLVTPNLLKRYSCNIFNTILFSANE